MEIPLLASKCPYCRSEVNLSSSSFWDPETKLEKKVQIVILLLWFIATHFVTVSFFGDTIRNTLQYCFGYICCLGFLGILLYPVLLFVRLCFKILSCFIDFD